MRIEYTKTKFIRPRLLDYSEYIAIKQQLKIDPTYNPFQSGGGFYGQFKVEILMYAFGLPLLGVLHLLSLSSRALKFLEWPVGIISIFLVINSLRFILEIISYQRYLADRNHYYFLLLKHIKQSSDYDHFKSLAG